MQIVTPPGIASYAHVFTAQEAMDPTKPPQYSLSLIWEEDNPKLAKLKAAIVEVAKTKWGAKAAQMLEKGQLKNPLRPGSDKPDDELYEGKVFLTARSKERPGVVNADAERLMSQDDFYSGCIARADIWLYPFEKAGNKGVAAILNNCQKLEDGDRIGGRRSAEAAFGGADDDYKPSTPAKPKSSKTPKTGFDDMDDDIPF